MTDLEEQIVARLDGLVEAQTAILDRLGELLPALGMVMKALKELLDASPASHGDRTEQSGYLQEAEAPPEPIEAGWLCQWPDCNRSVSIDQAEASVRWCQKVLCPGHDAQLRRVRENKKQAAA